MAANFLSALGAFLGHLAVAVALTGAFLFAYMRITPHHEIALIRKGNATAAIGLMGALIGFAIVLSRAIVVSSGVGEVIVWGVIGLAVQVAGHWALRLLLPNLHAEIEQGSASAGIVTGGTAIALGMLNAASMTP